MPLDLEKVAELSDVSPSEDQLSNPIDAAISAGGFLMREIELSNLLWSHVIVDERTMVVTVRFPASKNDIGGQGVTQVLEVQQSP